MYVLLSHTAYKAKRYRISLFPTEAYSNKSCSDSPMMYLDLVERMSGILSWLS